MPKTKNAIAFAGVGYTAPTRVPERSETELAVEACRNAALDAGMDPADLDGISIQVHHYPPADTDAIIRGLGMKQVNWNSDAKNGVGMASAAVLAQAIDRGECKAAVVCKILNTVAPVNTPLIDPETGAVPGPGQFEAPFGLGYTMQRVGMIKHRYMSRYGMRDEQLGWIPVVQREGAIEHPFAYQKKPITIDDYLASRWIAEPLRLLDCDIPVNAAWAYVITRGDIARTLRHPPVYLLGWGDETTGIVGHLHAELLTGLCPAAEAAYKGAGLGPKDMDIAYLYDGFSMFAALWLENVGLVGHGEAGAFVEGGGRIRRTGEMPLNTFGGNLSAGRMHGHGHIMEAVEQLRRTAGPRQVTKEANYAVVSSGWPQTGSVGILGRGA